MTLVMQASEHSARITRALSYALESFKPEPATAPVQVAERICLDAHNHVVRQAFKVQATALRLRSSGTTKHL